MKKQLKVSIRRLFCFMIVAMQLMSVASAEVVNVALRDDTEGEELSKIMGYAQGEVEEASELTVVGGKEKYTLMTLENDTLVIDTIGFKEGNSKELQQIVARFVKAMQLSEISEDRQQALMTEIQDTSTEVAGLLIAAVYADTKGDMYSAMKVMNPFMEALKLVLGLGAILLIFVLTLSTLIDLVYIGVPVWRNHAAAKEGDKGTGGTKPAGVTYEALTTVKEIEADMEAGNYKNAYLIYFKRRATTYIVLGVSLVYLIGGGLGGVITAILHLVSGITG